MIKKLVKKLTQKASPKKESKKPAKVPGKTKNEKAKPAKMAAAQVKATVAPKAAINPSKKSSAPATEAKQIPSNKKNNLEKNKSVTKKEAVKVSAIKPGKASPAPYGGPQSEDLAAKALKERKLQKKDLSDDESRWLDMYEKHKLEPTQSYNMKESFAAGKPLVHKLLGWGWVLSNDYDRLEVLFKDGKKVLISNYKPS